MDEPTAHRLLAVLGGPEDQVAIRPDGVYGRRLVRARPAAVTTTWQSHGTTLITGGLGALGGEVARWLASAGTEHIVLTARRGGDTPGAADLEAELTALGTRVTVASCDVADRDALAQLLATLPDLTAVVHAAGVLDDGVFDTLGLDRFERVLRPKVLGALNLHDLTRDRELAAFVLFSSVTGTVGNAGQANYAAANAFLDALAEHRRAIGLTATALAWGPWADAGMAMDGSVVEERLRRSGMRPMRAELAVTALRQAIERDETSLTIVDVDWARFVPGFTAARPTRLFADVPEAEPDQAGAPAQPGAALVSRLAELSAQDQERELLDLVRTHVAGVLGHGSTRDVNATRALKDAGFDSLTMVELRNVLGAATGLRLSASVVFDHPTPLALAEHLRAELAPPVAQGHVLDELTRLEAVWSSIGSLTPADRADAEARLLALTAGVATSAEPVGDDLIEASTLEELLDLAEEELRH